MTVKWRAGMNCTCLGEGNRVFVIAEIDRHFNVPYANLMYKSDSKREEDRRQFGWKPLADLERPKKIRRIVEYRAV